MAFVKVQWLNHWNKLWRNRLDPSFFSAFLSTRCLPGRAALAWGYSNFPEVQYSPVSVPWSWEQQLSFFQLRERKTRINTRVYTSAALRKELRYPQKCKVQSGSLTYINVLCFLTPLFWRSWAAS